MNKMVEKQQLVKLRYHFLIHLERVSLQKILISPLTQA